MKQNETIWVVLANGEHARVLVRKGGEHGFRTEQTLSSDAAHKRASDLGSDRPGRSFESGTVARHAVSYGQDLHQAAMRQFAEEIAKLINDAAAHHTADRFIVVAPNRTLGVLRACLSANAVARVARFLPKDLVKVPDAEIPEHLVPAD